LSERGRDRAADEREILHVLSQLMSVSRIYRMQLADIRPVVERLSEDYGPATVLLKSLAVADAQPPRLGTPRHLDEAAQGIIRDLQA
jgi:hypothetical protein